MFRLSPHSGWLSDNPEWQYVYLPCSKGAHLRLEDVVILEYAECDPHVLLSREE